MTSFRTQQTSTIPAWLIRVLVVIVLAGSVMLAVWSWHRLRDVNRDLQAATAQETRLANEVQRLELRWDPVATARVEVGFNQSLSSLFSGPEELANWQTEIQRQARLHEFENTTQFGAVQSRSYGELKLSVLPATIDLTPATGARSSGSTYRGLLGLTQALLNVPKRLDLIELSVTGGTNSVAQARAVLQLWSREGTP